MSVWYPVRVNTLQYAMVMLLQIQPALSKSHFKTTSLISVRVFSKRAKKLKSRDMQRNPQTKMTPGSGPGLGSISWSRDPGCIMGCPDSQVRDF